MKIYQKLKVLCISIPLIVISCSNDTSKLELNKEEVIVTGKILNLGEGTKTIRFASGSILSDIERTVLIDSSGKFRAVFEMSNPQNVQMFFKRGIALLYLKPHDSIFVDIDEEIFSKERFPDFRLGGTSSSVAVTKEILNYIRIKSNGKPFFPDAMGTSIEDYHKILEKEIILQDSILNNYWETSALNIEFKNWAEKEITYNIANYLIDYILFNPNYTGNLYNRSIFPVNDDEAIVSGYYGLHLRHYALNTYLWRDSLNHDLYEQELFKDAYSNALYGVLKEETAGLSRDIMCYKLLSELYSESFEDYEALIEKAETLIQSKTLRDELVRKKTDFESQTNYDISYLDQTTMNETEVSGDFWTQLKD